VIHRGIVELPEDVGDSLGWLPLDDDRQSPIPGHVSGPHHEVTQEKGSDGAWGDDGCAGSQSQRNRKSCRAPAFWCGSLGRPLWMPMPTTPTVQCQQCHRTIPENPARARGVSLLPSGVPYRVSADRPRVPVGREASENQSMAVVPPEALIIPARVDPRAQRHPLRRGFYRRRLAPARQFLVRGEAENRLMRAPTENQNRIWAAQSAQVQSRGNSARE